MSDGRNHTAVVSSHWGYLSLLMFIRLIGRLADWSSFTAVLPFNPMLV